MEQDTEKYWTDEFRNGNEKALSYFFNKHHKALYYFTSKLVQEQNQAEEIVSDAFQKLWLRRRDFQTEQNIKAFLFIASRNASFNHFKHTKRKTAAQEKYLKDFEESEEMVMFEYIQTEIVDVLKQEIEALPDKCREVFKMIYFENLKTDEIARNLGISVQTVRNQKTRAIELIRTSLLKQGISTTMIMVVMSYIKISDQTFGCF